jgi:hypothetical protein
MPEPIVVFFVQEGLIGRPNGDRQVFLQCPPVE